MTTTPPEYLPAARLSDEQGKICVNLPCCKCGYDLNRISFMEPCPHCGTPAYQSAASRDLQFDAQDRLSCDVPCGRCKYNLRAQPLLGACPECGQAVVHSTLINHLHFADPRWLQGLANGAAGVLATMGMSVACPVSVSIAIEHHNAPTDNVVYAIIMGFIAGPGLVGVWQATRPDPNLGRMHKEARQARHVRIAALCASLPVPISLMLDFLLISAKLVSSPIDLLIDFAFAFQLCAVPLFFYTFFKYLQWPMSRLPGQSLASHLTYACRGLLTALALGVLAFLAALLMPEQSDDIGDGITPVVLVLTVALVSWIVGVLFHVVFASRGAARRARNVRLLASRPPTPRVEAPPTRHNHADDA